MTLVPNSQTSTVSSRPSAARRSCSGVLGIAASIPLIEKAIRAVLDEADLPVEDPVVVVVEAHDHAAPDLHAGLLDAVHLLQQGAAGADVLELLRLAERLLVGALDADERGDEVGPDHQLHQLGVVGQVDRGLGEEGQRVVVPLLPGDHVAEHRLDRLLVADQVVVDDEDDRHPGRADRVELGDAPARRS